MNKTFSNFNYQTMYFGVAFIIFTLFLVKHKQFFIKRPARDACLCMGDLQVPPAPHFVFLITL